MLREELGTEQSKARCQLERREEAAAALWYAQPSKGPGACSSARWDVGKALPALGLPVQLCSWGAQLDWTCQQSPALWEAAVVVGGDPASRAALSATRLVPGLRGGAGTPAVGSPRVVA